MMNDVVRWLAMAEDAPRAAILVSHSPDADAALLGRAGVSVVTWAVREAR